MESKSGASKKPCQPCLTAGRRGDTQFVFAAPAQVAPVTGAWEGIIEFCESLKAEQENGRSMSHGRDTFHYRFIDGHTYALNSVVQHLRTLSAPGAGGDAEPKPLIERREEWDRLHNEVSGGIAQRDAQLKMLASRDAEIGRLTQALAEKDRCGDGCGRVGEFYILKLRAEVERLRSLVVETANAGFDIEEAYQDAQRRFHNFNEWEDSDWDRIQKARNRIAELRGLVTESAGVRK